MENPPPINPIIVTTVGEGLADASLIELVFSPPSGRLALLLGGGGKKRIADQIEYCGRIYRPPNLDEPTARAIRFPQDAKPYGSPGKLLRRILKLLERSAGLHQPESALVTAWTMSSWFADCLSSPPTLLISGPDMSDAVRLLRLLHCVCRRPVLLADLSRSAFFALAPLQATFLVNSPELSPRIRTLWATSNYPGFHVFGSGRVRSVAGSKAVFLGMADSRGDDCVHLALPPGRSDLPPLDERQLSKIALELQAQLLMYRLQHLEGVRAFSGRDHGSMFPKTELARNLAACVLSETDILESIAPLLRRDEQEKIAKRGCDVHMALVQAMWAPSHAVRELGILRLTELTNTLLRCRGEILEYSAAEVGWKLRSFGFRHHRTGNGMVLQFSHENRFLLHQLAAKFGLSLQPVADCKLCSPLQADDEKPVM